MPETSIETEQTITEATRAEVSDGTDGSDVSDVASKPFIGRWNKLSSETNWEKGRILLEWRNALIAAKAPSSQYSDEAWANRVGLVTCQHVGRLRRVFERFGETHGEYPNLYWSHFWAALDWDDSELWLEGASQSRWRQAMTVSSSRLRALGKTTRKPKKTLTDLATVPSKAARAAKALILGMKIQAIKIPGSEIRSKRGVTVWGSNPEQSRSTNWQRPAAKGPKIRPHATPSTDSGRCLWT
jgi:hypothetical protein